MTMKKRRIFIIGLLVLLLACPSCMIYITVKQQDGYKKSVADSMNEYMLQFLTMAVESKTDPDYKPLNFNNPYGTQIMCEHPTIKEYSTKFSIDKDLYEQWIDESFTKTVLEAKTKNHLLKAKTMAEEMGLVEGKDFFLIYDVCRTELEPEEDDGSTLTVIGFTLFDSEFIDKIGKKYQLYK